MATPSNSLLPNGMQPDDAAFILYGQSPMPSIPRPGVARGVESVSAPQQGEGPMVNLLESQLASTTNWHFHALRWHWNPCKQAKDGDLIAVGNHKETAIWTLNH